MQIGIFVCITGSPRVRSITGHLTPHELPNRPIPRRFGRQLFAACPIQSATLPLIDRDGAAALSDMNRVII
jgi:hypothetical protein